MIKKTHYLNWKRVNVKYMYDQLFRASDNAMRASSFFHLLVLQGVSE